MFLRIHHHFTIFVFVFPLGVAITCIRGTKVALISQDEGSITIYNRSQDTLNIITASHQGIRSPFDAVYTKDNAGKMALFFTETGKVAIPLFFLLRGGL